MIGCDGDCTYMSKHLILILQGGQPLFQLRILLLQLFHLRFQITQVCLLPLPCLLCWYSVPQQPFFPTPTKTKNHQSGNATDTTQKKD